jgi:hypothetical protein
MAMFKFQSPKFLPIQLTIIKFIIIIYYWLIASYGPADDGQIEKC